MKSRTRSRDFRDPSRRQRASLLAAGSAWESRLRARARRIEAHNAVVDLVRESGPMTVAEIAYHPSMMRHYSSAKSAKSCILQNLRSGYYPSLYMFASGRVEFVGVK